MAILQAGLAALANSASKILNTAFGWATQILFGKVPKDRRIYISVIAFGSVIWMVALLGVVFPAFAVWLLSFVKLPSWVDKSWIRIAMLVAAVLVPLIVGFVSILMMDPAKRPASLGGKAKTVLKGYPYTLGLAVTLVMMTLFAPVLKVRDIVRRWTSEHIPIIVEPPDYMAVVGDVQRVLQQAGIETHREPATWLVRLPTEVLTLFAGGAVSNLVADELTTLKGEKVEVLLHPSDLIVSGRELDAARAHAVVTEQLTFTRAYLTWTKEANEVEDRLRALWQELRGTAGLAPDAMARLASVERDLRTLKLDYEEWQTLYREKLQVERGMLQVAAGITDHPKEPTDAPPVQLSTARQAKPAPPRDTTMVEIPVPPRLVGPILAGAATATAFIALAWRTLTGGRRGALG